MIRARPECAVDADAIGITPCEKCGARGRAHGLRDVKVREFRAFAREPIDVRSGVTFRAKDSEVAIALVVREDDDDVRQALGGGRERQRAARQHKD